MSPINSGDTAWLLAATAEERARRIGGEEEVAEPGRVEAEHETPEGPEAAALDAVEGAEAPRREVAGRRVRR